MRDGVPICFEITSIPQKLVAPFDKEEITQALYQTLKQKVAIQLRTRNKRFRDISQ